MSLLESPIRVHADAGNGPEPMLLMGTETKRQRVADVEDSKVIYLCVDATGEIHELTKEWISVDWRHEPVEDKWKDLRYIGLPDDEEPDDV